MIWPDYNDMISNQGGTHPVCNVDYVNSHIPMTNPN